MVLAQPRDVRAVINAAIVEFPVRETNRHRILSAAREAAVIALRSDDPVRRAPAAVFTKPAVERPRRTPSRLSDVQLLAVLEGSPGTTQPLTALRIAGLRRKLNEAGRADPA